jgi:hypothetical protein
MLAKKWDEPIGLAFFISSYKVVAVADTENLQLKSNQTPAFSAFSKF